MKKNILVLVLSLFLLAGLFTIPIFNNLSVNRMATYSRYYDTAGYNKIAIEIDNNIYLSKIDREEFHEKLNELANEYQILVYKLKVTTTEEQNIIRTYLSDNDIFIENALLVKKGIPYIAKETFYSTTNSKTQEHEIPLIFSEVQVEVTSIINDNENYGYYNLINLNKESEGKFDEFIEGLLAEYPELSMIKQENVHKYKDNSDFTYLDSPFEPLLIKFVIVLILALLLCSKIFSLNKCISLLKIEGNSNFKIYLVLFFKPFIMLSLCIYSAFILLIFLCFKDSINTFQCIAQLFSIQCAQLFLTMTLISMVMYLIISSIPIMISYKGKNQLDEVELIAYAVKILICFLLIPITVPSYLSVCGLFTSNIREEHVRGLLNNYYVFSSETFSTYSQDIGSQNYIAVRDDLIWNNGLFDQSKTYFFNSNFAKEDSFYAVDLSYCFQVNLMNENDQFNEIYIFLKKGEIYNRELLLKKVSSSVRESIPINFVEYDFDLQSYSINDLLFHDEIEDIPLIYYPEEKGLEGQLNYKMIYYNGSLENAQSYVDNVFIMHGYSPQFYLSSLEADYAYSLDISNSNYFKSVINFFFLLAAYCLANKFFIEVDVDSNKKRYFIARTEGGVPYNLYLYLIKFASASVIAFAACLLSKRIYMDENSLILFLAFILIELFEYKVFQRKCRKVEK